MIIIAGQKTEKILELVENESLYVKINDDLYDISRDNFEKLIQKGFNEIFSQKSNAGLFRSEEEHH